MKTAVIQDHSVFFDKKACLEKVEYWANQARNESCDLALFPESFVPGYPRGFDFGTRIGSRSKEGRNLYELYHQESFDLESSDLKFLEEVAKKHALYLVLGVTEKQKEHGSLYCSMIYVSPHKGYLGVHRKIKPTGTERIIWAESDGKDLFTANTRIGRLGGLICWENYMPLARMAIYQKGVQIYLAPTADSRDEWVSSMKHIALEGRCFVLSANQYFTKDDLPNNFKEFVSGEPDIMCRGGSMIVSPMGKILAGPLYNTSGMLTAEIDVNEIIKAKLDFDPIAHYHRPDIFKFAVDGQGPMLNEEDLD